MDLQTSHIVSIDIWGCFVSFTTLNPLIIVSFVLYLEGSVKWRN